MKSRHLKYRDLLGTTLLSVLAITSKLIAQDELGKSGPRLSSDIPATSLRFLRKYRPKAPQPSLPSLPIQMVTRPTPLSEPNIRHQTGITEVTVTRGNNGGVADGSLNTSNLMPDSSKPEYACFTRNVKLEAAFDGNIPLFTTTQGFIFPGALFNALDIANGTMRSAALPTSIARVPYRISIGNLPGGAGTTDGAPPGLATTIGDSEAEQDFSQATYGMALAELLNRIPNNHAPAGFFVEFFSATTREEVATRLGFSLQGTIPPEVSALLAGIPLGVNLNVAADVNADSFSEKSRLILRVNTVNFTVSVSPPSSNTGFASLLSPETAEIDNNMLIASTVAYGSSGLIYFESTATQEDLQSMVSVALGVTSGATEPAEVSGEITDSIRTKFNSTDVTMKAFGVGLNVPDTGASLNSIEALKELIGTIRPWGAQNFGQPIGYALHFVKDGFPATLSYTTQFPSRICTTTPSELLRYDVDVELTDFKVKNVRDFDGGEDLFGKLFFHKARAGSQVNNESKILWKRTEETAARSNDASFVEGQVASIGNRHSVFKNLSFEELRALEIAVGGELTDDDFGDRKFKLNHSGEVGNQYITGGIRNGRLGEWASTVASMNSLHPSAARQPLTIGEDEFMNLDFYESGKKKEGHVRVRWRVLVTPHS